MKLATLCFLIRDNEICLAMKKRGFGEGKINGVGGKVCKNETIEQAALREMQEEIGVVSKAEHLESVGNLKFFFPAKGGFASGEKNASSDWDQHVHIFLVRNWEGEPEESEEMRPQWYEQSKIPFEKMWVDDPLWLPRVLEGQKIEGEFYFNEDGSDFEHFDVKEV